MTLHSFHINFESEDACRMHFKLERDKIGLICSKCNHTDHYWLRNKWSYECKQCKYRTSLRKGTIMESSKLSFLDWYKAIVLMSVTNKKISTSEIQRKLGLNRYESVWVMVNKLRKIIDKNEFPYTLERIVKNHKNYFTLKSNDLNKIAPKTEKGFAWFQAKVLDSNSEVVKDTNQLLLDLTNYIELNIAENINKRTYKSSIKSVAISICKTKKNLLNDRYKIEDKTLQLYLDEFSSRLNNEFFNNHIFDRIIDVGIVENHK